VGQFFVAEMGQFLTRDDMRVPRPRDVGGIQDRVRHRPPRPTSTWSTSRRNATAVVVATRVATPSAAAHDGYAPEEECGL
jgi:hypothetical protein